MVRNKDFVHNQYCGATWFTQQMKNEIIVSGNAGNIFVQYGSVWLANNDAGLKGMVTGAYTDNQMGQAVMNTQPQIVIDFIFQTGMNTTGLIQYFINLNCIDFLNKLYMVDPASIQQLYNVFFPGAPPTPVPQMINDLCTMVPAPSLANEVNNYNTMMGGFICPQVLYMYNGTDLYNSIIATYGSFTPFRPQMEVQPNIVDILYIYDPTGVDAIVYSQPDVFLMDIIANNDPCGMIQKALDIDINLALLTFMNGGYDINLFLSDINSYFGPAVHQAVLQAVYGSTAVGNLQEKLTLNELHIYGRNRVGILNANQQLEDWDYDGTLDQNTGQTTVTTLYASVSATISTTEFSRTLGQKSYELTNHLGNVLVTVSDRTIAMDDNTDGTIDYYLADVSTAQDYYAFGAPLPERKFEAPGLKYRYGFNGYEKDDDIKGEGNSYDFGARIQDPRLGRFLSIDPMSPKFPSTSPYSFAANTPIAAKDVNGEFAHLIIKYGIDVGINIATQMLTAYLFDDDVNSVSDAWDEVSLWQAFTEGAVDQLGTKKIRMAANATMQMFTYIDQVGMENATMEGMIMAGGMGLLEPIIGDAIAKYGNKAVAAGLKKANIDAGTIKKFTGFDVTRSRIQGVKPTFGGPLRAADGKTTTLLGVYATDMKRIIANNDVITGENAGGFNVLNIKDWTETKNMEWLQKAIDRGDVIRLVSDPAKATGTYKKELDYLVKHGYEIVGNEARKKVK